MAEESSQGLLEGSAEKHNGTCVFLFPAIEVAMFVAARATQVLADLGVAVGHFATWTATVGRDKASENSCH